LNEQHRHNPYADDQHPTEMYRILMASLYRMGTLTVTLDIDITTAHAACTLVSVACEGNHQVERTARALTWECAAMVNHMAHGREPEMTSHVTNADGEEISTIQDVPGAEFGTAALSAFFAAASVGNLPGAVAVLDAVTAEALRLDENPQSHITQFFGNMVASLAISVRGQIPDGLAFFKL
jgi:hypothetical protein